jgi:DUF1680 family protein
MRTLSSWPQYIATADADGIQLHQFATAELQFPVADGTARLAMETGYPWDGNVRVTVIEAPAQPWTLSLRVPGWCRSGSLHGPDGERTQIPSERRMATATRIWAPGDTLVLDLDMPVRATLPDPRIDAVRGCLVLERGPLVYCVETADLPDDVQLEEVEVGSAVRPVPVPRADVADSVIGLTVPATRRRGGRADGESEAEPQEATSVEVGAVPYFTWANRSVDAMRVWIPIKPAGDESVKDSRPAE